LKYPKTKKIVIKGTQTSRFCGAEIPNAIATIYKTGAFHDVITFAIFMKID